MGDQNYVLNLETRFQVLGKFQFGHHIILFFLNLFFLLFHHLLLLLSHKLSADICGAQNNYIDSLLILNGIYKDFFRNNNLNFDKLLKSNEIESLQINKFQHLVFHWINLLYIVQVF